MRMIFKININTEFEVNKLKDLKKLRKLMEVNKLDKPNFSKLARELGFDRRTVKNHYEGNFKKQLKKKGSMIDDYHGIVSSLLSTESLQIFYYKSHLYRYLQREHKLKCSRSNFNHYILKNKEFAEYFKPQKTSNSVKTETVFGKQAQFDWKEKLKITLSTGETVVINVGSLVLSASRFKVWNIHVSLDQTNLFDFLVNAFETLGGVPKEILIDNASTMMDKARTEYSKGKVNSRFQQFANDFGFTISPCIRSRPQTKAKVENPMRIIDEIMNYNGKMKDLSELCGKMKQITDEANSRICQATGLPPALVFKREKEHLLPLPNEKICSLYKSIFTKATVDINSLFKYEQKSYSVPSSLIGKNIDIQVIDKKLYVYYNKSLVTSHDIIEKRINYNKDHHLEIFEETFRNKTDDISDYADQHLRELERFNEQLSELT